MQATAILFSEMVPDPTWEARFNVWYDEEHIPDRMCLPHFIGVQRYRTGEGTYLVIYDMDGLKALKTPGYDKIKNQPSERTQWMLDSVAGFTRNLGTVLTQAGDLAEVMDRPHHLCATLLDISPDGQDAFDTWVQDMHLPELVGSCGALAARSFALAVAEPEPFTRLVLAYLPIGSGPIEPARRYCDEGAKTFFRSYETWGERVRGQGIKT